MIASLTRELTGIELRPDQVYLAESRLGPVLQESGCANFNELYFRVKYSRDAHLRNAMIDAITTNETHWFRDLAAFEALQFKVLPERIDQCRVSGRRRIRVWSAACSTGQEPYSIAMMLLEMLDGGKGWDLEVVGSDISEAALQRARAGEYSVHEAERSQREGSTSRWLEQRGDRFVVNDEVRRIVRFEPHNLIDDPPPAGGFDIVLLRNVLIYFAEDQRVEIVNRIRTALGSNGWLFLGAAESLSSVCPTWTPQHHCRAAAYFGGDAPSSVSP